MENAVLAAQSLFLLVVATTLELGAARELQSEALGRSHDLGCLGGAIMEVSDSWFRRRS